MVHLIHRKRVPLLHNTVLILCDEGDGLVAVKFEHFLCSLSYICSRYIHVIPRYLIVRTLRQNVTLYLGVHYVILIEYVDLMGWLTLPSADILCQQFEYLCQQFEYRSGPIWIQIVGHADGIPVFFSSIIR